MAKRIAVLVCCLATAGAAAAWEPVQLGPYPQKVRTWHDLNDPQVPPPLRANPKPLPIAGMTAVTVATDGAAWLGSTQGLMRVQNRGSERDRRQYLAGRRFLPDDRVMAIVPDEAAGVWVRTATGVSHIEWRPLTLAQKASVFEQRIRARHNRHGLVADCRLRTHGDPASFVPVSNDNDGLWTALYAAAECFRYRVTSSPEALERASRAIEAILFLEEVAGKRGFPARSFVRKGEPIPRDGEWHWTADGEYCWKGDTSSDEIVGHFFILSVAYDLLPDASLRRRIVETTDRIANHILKHGYTLTDLDGQPTLWGWWGPDDLARHPEERALNSLQWLSFLRTAIHITREPHYEKEYQKAVMTWRYPEMATRLNEFRTEMNYSDEELAMLAFYPLLLYEKDPTLQATYRRALEEWWKNMQREANPLWIFIYLAGNPEGQASVADAAWTLYRMPMDTITWTVRSSHRQDLVKAPAPDRFGKAEWLTLLPPDERPVMRWNANPFVVDGGDDGASEDDGAAFLLPYWMGAITVSSGASERRRPRGHRYRPGRRWLQMQA